MNIIQSSPSNTEQIVDLLKLSLGESTTKKSIEFWNWKHHQNPFGKSTIVLAFEQETLIGVRAFMKWKFVNNEQAIICGRAVDTAVHPSHQGKGIFTKLTLQALNETKSDGIELIFNTPNAISKRGYLKMGWIENGKMPVQFTINLTIPKRYNQQDCQKIYADFLFPKNLYVENMQVNSSLQHFATDITSQYINWRYAECPVNQYAYLYQPSEFLIVFRLKEVKGFIELRICEMIICDNDNSKQKATKELKLLISRVKPLILTSAKTGAIPKSFFKGLGLTHTLNIGPEVTLRNVSNDNTINKFVHFNKWQPSLGCMELF